LAKQHGATSSQPPQQAQQQLPPDQQSFAQNFMHPQGAPGGDENSPDLPLNSFGSTSRAGFNSVASDTINAVKVAASALNPLPKNDEEKELQQGIGGTGAMLAHRLISSFGAVLKPHEIAAAIHDINNSKDPVGTYLTIAQKTASQGAGQALTALGTEGAIKGAGAAVEGAGTAAKAVKGAVEPVSKAARVEKSVAKAGLAEGAEATPETKIPAQTVTTPGTEPEPAPTGTMHEPILQNAVRQQVNQLAKQEGLKPVAPETDLRDVGKDISNQLFARSKSGFDAVKKATGVDVNVLRDQITDLHGKLSEVFDNPEHEGAIVEKINGLEDQAEKAFEAAKAKGVDVDKPLADWRKSKAASDYGQQVRASVDPTQKSGTFDPGKYAPRLEKLYRSNPKYVGKWNSETGLTETPSRLEQLFGKAGSETMRDDAYAASETQQALKNFKPKPGTPGETTTTPSQTIPGTPATEGKALYEMVRNNTGRRFGVLDERTNWVKTYADFDKMTPAERTARFANPPEVEKTLLSQARNQRLRTIAAIGTAASVGVLGVPVSILKKLAASVGQ
jgi:hypothetical protein